MDAVRDVRSMTVASCRTSCGSGECRKISPAICRRSAAKDELAARSKEFVDGKVALEDEVAAILDFWAMALERERLR